MSFSKTYKIGATINAGTKEAPDIYGTEKEVSGPANMQELVASVGEQGAFDLALKTWKNEQSLDLRSSLLAKVKGEPQKQGRRAKAKMVDL